MLLAVSGLQGCVQSGSTVPTGKPSTDASVVRQQELRATLGNALASGQHRTAARTYQALADLDPAAATVNRLAAAQQWLLADDPASARVAADALAPLLEQSAPSPARDAWLLLRAQLALADHQPRRALAILTEVGDRAALQRSLLQADALALQGRPLDAIELRIAAEGMWQTQITSDSTMPPANRSTNQRKLLALLAHLSAEQQRNLRVINQGFPLAAWIELAALLKGTGTLLDTGEPGPSRPLLTLDQGAIAAWQDRHPEIALAPDLRETLMGNLAHPSPLPRHIALLLPLNGPLEKAGRAVLAGFLRGHYRLPPPRPSIVIIDTTTGVPADWLRQTAGAEVLVGPMQKQPIRQLEALSPPMPVLALNRVPQLAPREDLVQFGLAPEDDALSAATAAWHAGARRVAILAPDSEWGGRMDTAYAEAWLTLGGEVIARQVYPPDTTDYGQLLRQLLALDQSNKRWRRLQDVLGSQLVFRPRHRADIDAILLAARATQGRQLVPQLRFNYASDIPVYATWRILEGNGGTDADLRGVVVCDLPGRNTARNATNGIAASPRLRAMGEDAYALLRYWPDLRERPTARLAGASGTLSLDSGGVVRRLLSCAPVAAPHESAGD